jgi:hypothetical protein
MVKRQCTTQAETYCIPPAFHQTPGPKVQSHCMTLRYIPAHLFVLNTTTSSLLSSLDGLLVLCRCSASSKRAHQSRSRLERTLQITNSWLAKEMDLDLIALECALKRDNGLNQEWVGVLEVQVHDGHHSNTHHLCLVESLHLVDVVFVDGGCDELGLFGRSHLGLFDVFEGGHIYSDGSKNSHSLTDEPISEAADTYPSSY